jgi:hypothetical protein
VRFCLTIPRPGSWHSGTSTTATIKLERASLPRSISQESSIMTRRCVLPCACCVLVLDVQCAIARGANRLIVQVDKQCCNDEEGLFITDWMGLHGHVPCRFQTIGCKAADSSVCERSQSGTGSSRQTRDGAPALPPTPLLNDHKPDNVLHQREASTQAQQRKAKARKSTKNRANRAQAQGQPT